MIMMFNPRGKARKGKARRKASTYRRRRAARKGGTSRYRAMVRKFACSKHPMRTIAALRRRGGCTKRVPQLTVRARSRTTRGMASIAAREARRESRWASLWSRPAKSNPGLSIRAAGSGFMPKNIMDVAPVALGIYLNKAATVFVSSKLPVGWQSGWKNLAVATTLAGVSSIVPKFGSKLFVGSMTRVLFDGAALLMAKVSAAPGVAGLGQMFEQEYEM